jgi:integration host factor subunit alpha
MGKDKILKKLHHYLTKQIAGSKNLLLFYLCRHNFVAFYRSIPFMALTKNQIVDSIQDSLGFPRNRSVQLTETLLELVKKTLESGEDIMISGFGKFCVKEKNRRRGRNPATGEDMMLDERKVVTFTCSGKLRDRINS